MAANTSNVRVLGAKLAAAVAYAARRLWRFPHISDPDTVVLDLLVEVLARLGQMPACAEAAAVLQAAPPVVQQLVARLEPLAVRVAVRPPGSASEGGEASGGVAQARHAADTQLQPEPVAVSSWVPNPNAPVFVPAVGHTAHTAAPDLRKCGGSGLEVRGVQSGRSVSLVGSSEPWQQLADHAATRVQAFVRGRAARSRVRALVGTEPYSCGTEVQRWGMSIGYDAVGDHDGPVVGSWQQSLAKDVGGIRFLSASARPADPGELPGMPGSRRIFAGGDDGSEGEAEVVSEPALAALPQCPQSWHWLVVQPHGKGRRQQLGTGPMRRCSAGRLRCAGESAYIRPGYAQVFGIQACRLSSSLWRGVEVYLDLVEVFRVQ